MKHKRTGAVLYISATLLCVSCSSISHEEKSEPNSSPVTAILGAFEREVTLLEDRLSEQQEHQIEGIRFVTGKLHGRNVVVVWTGIGKVNAAMTTTLLIEHFKPEHIIFTGIAGAVNTELRPGDIVIAEKTAHHDMGTIWPEGLFVKGVKNRLDGIENPVFFPANKKLLILAQKAAEHIDMRRVETIAGQRNPKIVTGVIVTGDSFIASTEKCAELRKKLKADAVEMEGAAVAQICYQRQIDHLVIRSISDSSDEGAVTDKQMFYILAAKNSSDLVAEMIALLGTSPTTAYAESAAGIEQGGRIGFTSSVVGILFLLALLFVPIVEVVPKYATSPALIMVGLFMTREVKRIDFTNMEEAFPSFIIMVMIALSYSISTGLAFGFVSFTLIKTVLGKAREIKPAMWVNATLSVLFLTIDQIPPIIEYLKSLA